jgi:hypothetical protein
MTSSEKTDQSGSSRKSQWERLFGSFQILNDVITASEVRRGRTKNPSDRRRRLRRHAPRGRAPGAGRRGDRVFDNLDPQVHGEDPARPRWLARDAELIVGDVRDADRLARAVRDADVIFHLAAAVGVGQSMYRIAEYTATNTLGTAHLLQALVDGGIEPERLVVASSMSIYGEGRYVRPDGRRRRRRGATPSSSVATTGSCGIRTARRSLPVRPTRTSCSTPPRSMRSPRRTRSG